MGIVSENQEVSSHFNGLFDNDDHPYDYCLEDYPSTAILRLKHEYDDIAELYRIDTIAADRKRLHTLSLVHFSLTKSRGLTPKTFYPKREPYHTPHHSIKDNAYGQWPSSPNMIYVKPDVREDYRLDANIWPTVFEEYLRMLHLFKEVLKEWHTEKGIELHRRFYDIIRDSISASPFCTTEPPELHESRPRPSCINEIISVEQTREGSQALISWKPTRSVIPTKLFDELFLRRDEVKQVRDIIRTGRARNRIECTVDWRESHVILPAGVSLARLEADGFGELEQALHTSVSVRQTSTNRGGSRIISSPVHNLTTTKLPVTPPGLVGSDYETDRDTSSSESSIPSSKDWIMSKQGVMFGPRLRSIASHFDSHESEYLEGWPQEKGKLDDSPTANVLCGLEDHINDLGRKEPAPGTTASDRLTARRRSPMLRTSNNTDYALSQWLSHNSHPSYLQEELEPAPHTTKSPWLTMLLDDDFEKRFITRPNAPGLHSPILSPCSMSDDDPKLKPLLSSGIEDSSLIKPSELGRVIYHGNNAEDSSHLPGRVDQLRLPLGFMKTSISGCGDNMLTRDTYSNGQRSEQSSPEDDGYFSGDESGCFEGQQAALEAFASNKAMVGGKNYTRKYNGPNTIRRSFDEEMENRLERGRDWAKGLDEILISKGPTEKTTKERSTTGSLKPLMRSGKDDFWKTVMNDPSPTLANKNFVVADGEKKKRVRSLGGEAAQPVSKRMKGDWYGMGMEVSSLL